MGGGGGVKARKAEREVVGQKEMHGKVYILLTGKSIVCKKT